MKTLYQPNLATVGRLFLSHQRDLSIIILMANILMMFLLGLVILLISTQKLVKLAERISRIFGISPLIIGVTLVAIGTSLPELAVSIVAMIRNDGGLALGNIVGSNIVNILLVMPVAIGLGNFRIGSTKTQTNAGILLGVTAIYLTLRFLNLSSPIFGVMLIIFALALSFLEYKLGINGRGLEDKKWFKHLTKKDTIKPLDLVMGATLMASIVAGGSILVESIEQLSRLTNISTTILGLTITAVATSLPELLTTVFSQRDHQEKIAVGNILGSNIYNLMLIGGMIMLFPASSAISLLQWWWLIGSTIFFVLVIGFYSGKHPPRWLAAVFFLLFILYLITQKF